MSTLGPVTLGVTSRPRGVDLVDCIEDQVSVTGIQPCEMLGGKRRGHRHDRFREEEIWRATL
jgi:hypothetical protein